MIRHPNMLRATLPAVRACAVTLLLVGSGLLPSVAVATEVPRNGPVITKQCGAERSGCGWCGASSCYKVTTCNATTCTVVRVAPQVVTHRQPTHGTGPVLHGGYTNPTGPTIPSTHKHQ
jgi:hypothetical protein